MNRLQGPHPSALLEQQKFAITRAVDDNLKNLWRIWDQLGIDESQKKARSQLAIEHVQNLLGEMVTEEQNLFNKFVKSVDDFSDKLRLLCEELNHAHVQLSGGLTLVQQEKILRAKVETLTQEKNDRLEKYRGLHDRDQQLCEVLCATPYYVPSGVIPTIEQLKELEKHVAVMHAEKDKRYSEFVILKKKIVDLYNTLECDPDTSFGRDLVCEEDDTFGLSPTNMETLKVLHKELVKKDEDVRQEVSDLWDRLKALWTRLETPDIDREEFELNKEGHGKRIVDALTEEIRACELLKFQNMQKFVLGIRKELLQWWDKCFLSQQQRSAFTEYSEENYTEELLDAHERELARHQEYFRQNRVLFEKMAHREKLFKEFKVFEEKASDPNRFFNDRGGKLLLEEKARKKLEKELPKVEREVAEAVHVWEKDNGKDFLVHGMKYQEFVRHSWDDHHRHKEEEKQSRLTARAKQAKEEAFFGSKTINSPRKGLNPTTPRRTPLKARKLNDLTRTPNTCSKLPNNSRFQHSTMLYSPACRQPLYTPKTPLPKTTASKKRRSSRLMKKAATERKSTSKRRKSRQSFSHTTVSSDDAASSSLASTGTYLDFAGGLRHPNSRSSVLPPSSPAQTPLFRH